MDRVRHLLDGESLSDDMSPVDGRVFHIHPYLLAEELLVHIPYYRVAIHDHTRVQGVIYQGVAHRLHIDSIGAYMVVGVYLAIYRVGIDVEGKDLKCVCVHV